MIGEYSFWPAPPGADGGQNGFQVGCGVNFKYPTLAPNRNAA